MIKQLNTIDADSFFHYLKDNKKYDWSYIAKFLNDTQVLEYTSHNDFTIEYLNERIEYCKENKNEDLSLVAYTEIKEFMIKNNLEQLLFLN